MDGDEEAQSDEMMAIECILDPHSLRIIQMRSPEKPTSGLIKVDFHFPLGFTVKAVTRREDKSFQKLSQSYSHLPPLILHFILPNNYPSQLKPIFTLSSTWLDRTSISRLCAKLDEIWDQEKGSVVLFSWYSFLQDCLIFLNLTEYDVTWCYAPSHHRNKKLRRKKTREFPLDSRAVFERRPEQMLAYLTEFNEEEAERVFRITSHNCAICISDKKGKSCHRFRACGHIYCIDCISHYFKGLITEGNLDGVRCPSYTCDVVPEPSKVKEIVGEELFERYDRLLLKRTLENMSDIITCPLPKCQCPVICDPSDKLAKCPSCFYVFCSCCKAVYHGVEPCRFKSDERKAVYEKYTKGSVEEKNRLEKTFGKKQLDLLVQTVLSEDWVTSRSKPCPHCSVPIEKFEGCNKVTCFKCNTYFCWICSVQLDHGNPYFHFNDPSSKCFDNLFLDVEDLGPNSDDEDDDWFDYYDESEEDETW